MKGIFGTSQRAREKQAAEEKKPVPVAVRHFLLEEAAKALGELIMGGLDNQNPVDVAIARNAINMRQMLADHLGSEKKLLAQAKADEEAKAAAKAEELKQ